MKTISLAIDEKRISCSPGASILKIAEENHIYIPTLCSHPELKPHGACRICIVEEKKSNRLLASCVTPVADQMVIHTSSPRVLEHRRNILRLMMAEHPDSCLVCSKSNKCDLRKIASELNISETNLYPMHNYTPLDQSNPFINRDMTKCILCGKCIRACKELVCNGTIDYSLRGFKSRPSTAGKVPLGKSDCLFCGTCASICPTGAITQSTGIYSGTTERDHESICGFCGVGCSITLGITGNRIITVNPSKKKNSVNGVTLCVRGHFALDYLNSPKRLKTPILQKKGETIETSWETALTSAVEGLLEIKENFGPESIGFYGSSKCTNEENYLFQKIARAGLGTGNIDNGGFLFGRNMLEIIDKRTGLTSRVNKFDDLKNAEVIFIVGAEPGKNLPVLNYHIKRAVKKGATLIVLDHKKSELSTCSDIWLKPVSGINFAEHCTILANCFSAYLFETRNADLQFVEWFTKNYDDYCEELNNYDMENAVKKTGISIDLITKTIQQITGKKVSFVIGCEILEQGNGRMTMDALINLSLMTGCFGGQGCGFHVLAKENNLIGSWDMGTVPDMLPGRKPLENEKNRKNFETAWGSGAIVQTGLSITGMIEAAEKGKLKALYIMGENPLRSLPQTKRIKKALKKLDLLIIQDILENETTELADIILPAAPPSEKSGSFTNTEGRIQLFSKAVEPAFHSKSDFTILSMIAEKIGLKTYNIEKTRKEISVLVPIYSELAECPDTAWIKRELSNDFNDEAYIQIVFSSIEEPKEHEQDNEYPYTAVVDSLHCHAGCGTRTSLSERINNSPFHGDIEISEKTATLLKADNGNSIRVTSPYGTIMRKIRLNSSVNEGTVFIPRAYNDNDVMNLFPFIDSKMSKLSGFNRCHVRIEKI